MTRSLPIYHVLADLDRSPLILEFSTRTRFQDIGRFLPRICSCSYAVLVIETGLSKPRTEAQSSDPGQIEVEGRLPSPVTRNALHQSLDPVASVVPIASEIILNRLAGSFLSRSFNSLFEELVSSVPLLSYIVNQ